MNGGTHLELDPDEALGALRAICRHVSEATDATCGLRQALEWGTRLLRGDVAAIYGLLPGGAAQPIVWYSSSFRWDCEASEPNCRTVYAARVASSGIPELATVTCPAGAGPGVDAAAPVDGPPSHEHSLAAVPVRTRGEARGAVVVEAHRPASFGPAQLAFLEPLATLIGLALDNSLLLGQVGEQYDGFRAILESSSDGLVLVEGDQVVYCNQRALDLCGIEPDELYGGGVALLHGYLARNSAQPEEILRRFDEETGGRRRWSLTYERRGPERRLCQLEVFPIEGPDKCLLGHGYRVRDVTEELEFDRLKSELISVISHELVSPITVIKGLVTTLGRQDVVWAPEEQAGFIRDIREETDRLYQLVQNILETTRLETGVFKPDLASVRVDHLVERCLGVASQWFPQADIGPGRVDEGLTWVLDARGLERAILNLLDNAVKYADGEPWVRLSAYRHEGDLLVEVADHGIGIDPASRKHIFDKFYRGGDPRVRRRQGSGLGLSLVRGIVEAHGGRIWVEARGEPGDGTRPGGSVFRFRLPFREEDAREGMVG